MNKQCYRVVFNKARGMFMVVSEITKSQNKTAGNGSSKKSTAIKSESQSGTKLSYSRLAVAILCCQSMIYTQVQAANSQIQNTASNVPAAQRAALLKATNGTPIVNIRTPNSNGLSHNTYNQFDIGSNGAILNNSIGVANTQLAGAITGNQYLAKTAANTILNEVRSSAPTKFQGNLEIAGQRADVIIASPSGLQIQGGGFINANQATLTTGKPKIDSAGNLTGFDVKQGEIQFDNAATGNALGGDLYDGKNKNQANYVDVLARAVTINGQIHANQDVNIVSGSNTVDYDTGEATKITGTGTVPTLAVDVSTLGGIYAGSINLVGTENGLGVRNAGTINATQQIVLTNSGKIENTGAIQTTKAQTSLLSINATGTTGSIEHSGTIGSYGMIDMQADKDITLNKGLIRKNSAGTAVQLMPDIIRIDAGGTLKVSNISDIRNKNIDDQTNIYTHSTLDTIVDSKSAIASNGGVSIDADRYVRLLDTSSTSVGVAALNISSKSGTTVDNATVAGSGDVYINSRIADTTISNNSKVSAVKNLTISANRNATVSSGTTISKAENLILQAGGNALIDNSGSIVVTNDAAMQAGELAYLKNISQPTNIGKQLIVQGKQATVLNTTANANEGIYINSQGKDTTITNSNLNSAKGAITAIANQAALNVNKLNTNANSTILAATGDVSIVGNSKLTTDNIAIESGQNLTATQLTTVNKDSKQIGSINTKSKGTTDITSSQLKNTGNISVNSDKYLTIIDTGIDSGKNLNLQSKQAIYSNARLDKNAEGVAFNNYDVSTKQNTFTAADVLILDSTGLQRHKDTDFKGSAMLLNAGSSYSLSSNLNFTTTGASTNVDKNINGNIQFANKGVIALNQNHTISAKNDLTIQADKGITITKAPKIVAQNIALKTTAAGTVKSDKGVDNTFGDGDINIVGTELSATGTTGNGLVIDAANHLNVIDSQTKSVGSTTMKSGNLMRLNNSDISSGQHLTIDSKNQLITNGERYAKNVGTQETPKWRNSLKHIAGDTILHADEIVSINSIEGQPYQNTGITGGAVIINSGSTIGLNTNTNINATGNAKLAKNTTKLSDGRVANTLNGDLIISSAAGTLTVDPTRVTLGAAGDATLAARGGQLYLKGYKGTQGLGSEKVVKLTAGGDINLSGKEVVIEGSDLISKKGFSGSNVVLVDGKSVTTAGISITATDGSVELKAIKNSFSNYVSPYKIKSINAEIDKAKAELSQSFHNTKWEEDYKSQTRGFLRHVKLQCEDGGMIGGGESHCASVLQKDRSFIKEYSPQYLRMIESTIYKEYGAYLTQQSDLRILIADLNQTLETSKKASTGFEHKTGSLTGSKDINITAKQGVLIEGTEITSSAGGITITAEGNLAPVEVKDDNDKTIGINYDSIRITGLADIYQQGDVNKAGKVTGPNYSYHQLINQPKLTADKDIKILAQGGRPLNSASIVLTDNNAVNINSADIQSTNGDVRIDAARGDINLEASQVAFMDGSQATSTSRSWYGKKKTKTTTKTSENSNAVTTDIQANNITLNADGNIRVYGSELAANASTGQINLKAGDASYIYAVENIDKNTIDIKKKSSWLGVRYNKEHTNDTRQELSQLPAKLVADSTHLKSGGNTVIQGAIFNSNSDNIQVGVGTYADANAKIILTTVINQITTTHNQEKESTVWMKTVDQGSVVTTASLPKFNQTPTMTDANGKPVEVSIDVPVSVNNDAKASIQKGTEELGKIALNLSKQPGYEYLAALDKNNDINWVQVDLIQKNWNYTQEGLTPGAAALIAIAITIAAGPAGSGLTASMIATNAAGIALQTQAVITLINNKGDISKTLKDMASSDTIRNMATAALTAGVGAKLGLGSSVNDTFAQKLANGVGTGVTNAVADAALNGASFEEALKNSLRGALVDVFAAETFGKFVKDFEGDDFASNLAHKLVAAGVGCATASAKKQDCNAGAIGAAVGETIAQFATSAEDEVFLSFGLLPPDEMDRIENISKLTTGAIALLLNVDVDIAANSASLAVKNNHNFGNNTNLNEGVLEAYAFAVGIVLTPVGILQSYADYNKASTDKEKAAILVGLGFPPAKAARFVSKAKKIEVPKQVAKTCSFRGDMLVQTITGYKPISEVQIGNMVLSKNEITGKLTYQSVSQHYNNAYSQTVYINIEDENGNTQTIVSNKIHPFFTQVNTGDSLPSSSEGHNYQGNINNAQWIDASNLKAGYKLLSEDGQWQVVQSVRQTEESLSAYNLTVNNDNTYFVTGSNSTYGVWVHNTCVTVSSLVKNDTLLLREAKKLSQQESQGINQMLEQVRKGNNNPGVGTKVFNGITEFRHANGGRLYARKSGSSWEILGYSGKGNQSTVINRLITLYGK